MMPFLTTLDVQEGHFEQKEQKVAIMRRNDNILTSGREMSTMSELSQPWGYSRGNGTFLIRINHAPQCKTVRNT